MYSQKHQGPKIVNPVNFSHGYTQFKCSGTVHFKKSYFLSYFRLDELFVISDFFSHYCSAQNVGKQIGRALHWEKIETKKGTKKEKKGNERERRKERGREKEFTSEQNWAFTDLIPNSDRKA